MKNETKALLHHPEKEHSQHKTDKPQQKKQNLHQRTNKWFSPLNLLLGQQVHHHLQNEEYDQKTPK